ncbi:hypothetical protein LX32DRAFT_96441 [Colletotrichum zoysiae]|uniref:BZIP domain-containing protein n=1 Tax=Colletotrichum zoysiae TaxID=1216348 RepID=A0AAD9H9A7_9PEZI|nr:hypothetical protein LX32DRAFT_96441 [Colletotrichum zoysiae]
MFSQEADYCHAMVTKRPRPSTERSRELNRLAQRRLRAKRQHGTVKEHSMSHDSNLNALSTTEQPTGLLPAVEGHRTEPRQFCVIQDATFGNLSPAETIVGGGWGAAETSAGGSFHDAMAPYTAASSGPQDPYLWLPPGYDYDQCLDYYRALETGPGDRKDLKRLSLNKAHKKKRPKRDRSQYSSRI